MVLVTRVNHAKYVYGIFVSG